MHQYVEIQYAQIKWQIAYQEISNGVLQRYLDPDGKEITLPDPCESRVTDDNPKLLDWMIAEPKVDVKAVLQQLSGGLLSDDQKSLLQTAIDSL